MSDAFTGHYARFLTNAYIEEFRASGTSPLPLVVQQMASRDIIEAAGKQGNPSWFPLYAAQGVGMIEHIPSASAVVRSMIDEARATLEALPAAPPAPAGRVARSRGSLARRPEASPLGLPSNRRLRARA